MRVNENRNFDSADAPSQSWLSPHERKDSGIRPRTATSIPLRSISVVAVATSSESLSQRARELRFR